MDACRLSLIDSQSNKFPSGFLQEVGIKSKEKKHRKADKPINEHRCSLSLIKVSGGKRCQVVVRDVDDFVRDQTKTIKSANRETKEVMPPMLDGISARELLLTSQKI